VEPKAEPTVMDNAAASDSEPAEALAEAIRLKAAPRQVPLRLVTGPAVPE